MVEKNANPYYYYLDYIIWLAVQLTIEDLKPDIPLTNQENAGHWNYKSEEVGFVFTFY